MLHFRPLRTLAVAVVAATCLLATACADTGTGTGAAGPAGAAAAADDSRPADTSAEISVAQFGQPTTLDPHKLRSPRSDPGYLSPLYDQLLRLDANLEIQPMLASSYDMAPDGKSITLRLREGVRFKDGTGFDSAVVMANFERARTLDGSTVAPQLATVASIETPDPQTVAITFSEPNHTFPYTLASSLGISSMISGKAIADGVDLSRTAAGSGPYTLVTFGQDRVSYERSDDYWDQDNLPALRRVTIIGMDDDNARLAALQSGQVQVAVIRPNQAPAYEDLLASGQFTKQAFSGQAYGLYVNTGNPALADPRVRKAMSLAIDRTATAQALFNGQVGPAFQPYPEGMAGHVAAADTDPHDPEAARRLLAEAGQTDLRLSVILASTEPGDSIATIAQAQLAEVGITLDLQKYAPTDARPSWRQGEADMFASAFTVGADPSDYVKEAILGPDNPGGAPADVAAAANAALNMPVDDPQRAAAFEALTTLLNEQPLHLLSVRVPLQYLADSTIMHLDQMSISQYTAMIDVRALAVAEG